MMSWIKDDVIILNDVKLLSQVMLSVLHVGLSCSPASKFIVSLATLIWRASLYLLFIQLFSALGLQCCPIQCHVGFFLHGQQCHCWHGPS